MKRSELISSKEYWATVVALQMWKLNGAKNDKFEKYESMANAIVNDDFIRAMEEYRTQCDKLPGDEEIQDHVEDVDVNFDEEIGFMMGAKWMRSLASPIIASKDARIRELEEENKKLQRMINLCKASINGALDGLELDNTSDVIEKSLVIEHLEENLKILAITNP